MSDALILTNQKDAVFEIQLNRPEKMNALTDAMYGDLVNAIATAEADEQTKVILLRSSGPHFSAGNDLADFLQNPFDLDSNVVQFLVALARASKPVVAAVNGAAVGIGTTMLLHCDLVYASKDVKFSVPFIKLGLTPEGGSSQLLARRCGEARAQDWLFTGRNVLADEAMVTGLVNYVFDDAAIAWEEADKAASKMARQSAAVLQKTKRLLKPEPEATVELINKEALVFRERLASEEAKAAFNAFLGKN